MGARISVRFSGPHSSSTMVSANGNAVPVDNFRQRRVIPMIKFWKPTWTSAWHGSKDGQQSLSKTENRRAYSYLVTRLSDTTTDSSE